MSALYRPVTLILALLSGCGAGSDTSATPQRASSDNEAAATSTALPHTIRVDVFPATLVEADGSIRALPQTFGTFEVMDATVLQLPEILQLREPGTFAGEVLAATVTPWADGAQVPSVAGPVQAEVRLSLPSSVQNYDTRSDQDGLFAATVASPEGAYLASVVPDDPLIPFETRTVGVAGDVFQTFDLGIGLPIYGRVLGPMGEALPGVQVHAVDSFGTVGAVARADTDGWYLLRVLPGDYDVMSLGRDHGRDAVLTWPGLTVDQDAGLRVDFTYPNLSSSPAIGRVVDSEGNGVDNVTVRFSAKTLDGYDELDASLIIEDVTTSGGNFDATLQDGVYRVEFLPEQVVDPADDYGAVLIADSSERANGLSLGNVELPSIMAFQGQVVDVFGVGVGEARLSCTEVGFGGRSWDGAADSDGFFELIVPPTALSCTIVPPGGGSLAWTTEIVDPSISDGHIFEVQSGTRISGRVRVVDSDEPFAVVDVRDAGGTLLGTTLTDDDGRFSIRVAVPEQQ